MSVCNHWIESLKSFRQTQHLYQKHASKHRHIRSSGIRQAWQQSDFRVYQKATVSFRASRQTMSCLNRALKYQSRPKIECHR